MRWRSQSTSKFQEQNERFFGFGFFNFSFILFFLGYLKRKSTKIPSLLKNIPSITCEFFSLLVKSIIKVPWGLFLSLFLPCRTFHKIKESLSVSSYPLSIPFLKDKSPQLGGTEPYWIPSPCSAPLGKNSSSLLAVQRKVDGSDTRRQHFKRPIPSTQSHMPEFGGCTGLLGCCHKVPCPGWL